MTQETANRTGNKGAASLRTVFVCVSIVAVMTGLSFAAVPLYNLFCAVTGYNGTVQTGQAAPGATERTITVRCSR